MSRVRPAPHARFTARASALRAASMRRRMLLAGGAVLAIALVWVIWFSPLLAVRSVQVSGADGQLGDQVRVKADSAVGRPLVRTDPAAVRHRLERIPAVRSATVSRSVPNTLRVQVRPRVAVVVVEHGGERRLVDADGVAFGAASGDRAAELPVVRLGDRRTSGRDVASVATVMAAVPAKDRDQVKDLRLSRIGHVSFTIDGLKVTWGDRTQTRAKASSLATMRPIAAKERSRHLDLTSPKRPVLS